MTTRTRTLSLAMICLMVFSTTLVHAATISTFANGNPDVDVELRDQGTWGDDLTAGISMPAGETVNEEGFIDGSEYAEHDDVQVIASDREGTWEGLLQGCTHGAHVTLQVFVHCIE